MPVGVVEVALGVDEGAAGRPAAVLPPEEEDERLPEIAPLQLLEAPQRRRAVPARCCSNISN